MRKIHFLIPFLLLIASCAVIITPGGGPKDSSPPFVVEYQPDSAATNFNAKRIIIRFNEYVQLTDLNNQLIVSPQLNEQPDVTIRKKEIVIDMPDSLLPNTTYTISFGSAIKDITENNVLDNFRYVFSTGPAIDSLTVSGNVKNASSLTGEKNVLVMLYRSTGDSVPYKERPYYFTKTRPDGSFRINNLKAGTYKAFALDDKNQNYMYDNSDERIAFSDSLIVLQNNLDSLSLKMFRELPSKQKRVAVNQISVGHISLVYARPISQFQISTNLSEEEKKNLYIQKSANNDSIDLWLGTVTSDSLEITVRDGTSFTDSVELELEHPGKKKTNSGRGGGNAEARKLRIATNIAGSQFPLGKTLQVNSTIPVKELNKDLILLLRGKDTLKAGLTISDNRHAIYISNTFMEDSSYTLLLKPGAVTDWFGQKSDTLLQKFHIPAASEYGTLKVSLNGIPKGNYILQLLNEKGNLIQDSLIQGETTISFKYINSGNFLLKLISDENKNGKWDTGNYLQHQQAENVRYYTKPIKMRTGWDMDVEWNFK